MNLNERLNAFSILGEILRDVISGKPTKYTSSMDHLIETQHPKNPWFTPGNVRMAIKSVAEELTPENLTKWTDPYSSLNKNYKRMNVGVIMAGNIPLVGFHDCLSVLITGNNLIAKTSSKDPDLIPFLCNILCEINNRFNDRIKFTDKTLSGFDAIIATGTDNTSRYFDYYFGKYPNIIRSNRNGIAILTGDESTDELEDLGKDVFTYFGLGCRNVSKIFIPSGYDLSVMTEKWHNYSGLIRHEKYANNYNFSKAVYLVNKEIFTDTGFLLLREAMGLASPLAVLYFEYFSSEEDLLVNINNLKDKIQCIMGSGFIPFGKSQSTDLWDYADGVDTIEFLLKINSAGIL